MKSPYADIADGLAEAGYAWVDEFLTAREVAGILQLDEFKAGLLQFNKAGIGKGQAKKINESIRGDYVQWIDHRNVGNELRVYFDRLNDLMSVIRETLFVSLKDYEVHLTCYPPGTVYQRHLDQFKSDDHRRLSIILYLNENWKEEHGGQLRLHVSGGPVDILPLAGRLACFRSDQVEHEVLPASRERLSITGWMLDQWADLRHL